MFGEFLENGYNPIYINQTENDGYNATDNSKQRKHYNGFKVFNLRQEDCPRDSKTTFNATRGIVTGQNWPRSDVPRLFTDNYINSAENCSWTVLVPDGHHISVAVRLGDIFCKRRLGK